MIGVGVVDETGLGIFGYDQKHDSLLRGLLKIGSGAAVCLDNAFRQQIEYTLAGDWSTPLAKML
jgi:hypothetical protein